MYGNQLWVRKLLLGQEFENFVLQFYMAFIAQKSYNIFMKILQALVLLLVISTVSAEPLQLFSASTSIDSTAGVLTGSMLGGRTIYIKGIGFPTDPTTLQVFIGNYPCKIPADGLTPTTLSCQTTSIGSVTPIYNLPIKVIYNSQVSTLPNTIFSYIEGDTPIIYDMYPSSSAANRMIQYVGRHRIVDKGDGQRDMGDFIGLYVGNQLCGLFDIDQGQITYNGIHRVKCLQAREQQAGKYNVSEHVVAGWATKDWPTRRASLTNQFHQFTVIPAITSMSTNSGSPTGQDITVTGTGFSKDKTKIQVSVDGVNCAVSSSSLTSISCRLAAKKVTDTSAIDSNAANPANRYISGVGFKYQRYNISGLVNRNIAGFRNAVNSNSAELRLIEQSYVTQLQTQDVYSYQGYGQVFKGYFYAPVTGNYIFRGAADDTFTLLISSEYGTTNSSLTQQIYETTVGVSDQNHYISNHTTAIGNPKPLTGGKYYYMQAYHINWIGPGYFKISVQVPNTDTTLFKKRYQINHIQTIYTNDPQIMTFTLDNAIGGTFNLSIYRVDPTTLQVTYNKKVQVGYNASVGDFQNAINQFDLYDGYYASCVDAKAYDASGNVVSSSSASAIRFQWTVSVWKLRTTTHLSQKFTTNLVSIVSPSGTSPTFTQTRTHAHGPLIQGTFTMTVGGYPIRLWDPVSQSYSTDNIPHNVTAWTLMNALRQIAGFEKVDVYRANDPDYGAKWFISYFQYAGNVPDIVVSGSALSGGRAGTSPSISATETRPYSTNIVFNPISQIFLFTPSPNPSIQIKVNNIPNICLTNCQYGFLPDTPVVTGQSLTGSTLSITISNPQNYVIPLQWLTVKLDSKICNIQAGGTFTSFSCLLPASGGVPLLKAGLYDVDILVMELGYLPVFNTTAKINYTMGISSVVQASGPTNGGYQVVINGQGFPDAVKDTKITLCGVQVQILSISTTQAKILAPPCSTPGPQTLTLQSPTQTATSSFSYTTPSSTKSLLSIFPKSASPVLKAVMTITGTGFGTNITALNVYLSNTTGKVYKMRVLQANDSVIRCGIPGGLPGMFDVKVSVDGYGDIMPVDVNADDFVYELVVDGVSAGNVAYYGGNVITITGRNFSPDILENLVHIGNQLNWLCDIQSLTTSQIKCRVPQYHPDWASSTQPIIINNRLIQDSTCSSTCQITYSDKTSSPTLTSLSTTDLTSNSGVLNIYGTNLNLITVPQVIFVNKLTREKTIVGAISSTAGGVTVNVPNIKAGYYNIKVRQDPYGETNSIQATIKGAMFSTNVSVSVKGATVAVNGLGLPTQWPSKMFSIKLFTDGFYLQPKVVSTTSTKLQIQIPQGTPTQWYLLTLTNPLTHSYPINISHSTASTPTVQVLSTTTLTPGMQSLSLNRTNLATTMPDSISLYNVLNPNIEISISSAIWTVSGSVISFNYNIKAGKYGVKVYYGGYGWASVQGNVNVQASGAYTAAVTDVSFAGGEIVVNGNGISEQAVLRVGGFVGKASSVTATTATFEVPALITPTVLQSYPQLKHTTKLTPSTIISDSPLKNTYTFDSLHSSWYSSPNPTCYIGIDIGQGKKAQLSRIRYFPYHKWTIASKYLLNAIFQASNDGITYTQVGIVDSTVHSGWNSLLVNSNMQYRYVRFRHDGSSGCKIAELEVYGVVYNDVLGASLSLMALDAVVDDGFNQVTLSQVINYRNTNTPVVNSIVPDTVSVYGNQVVTITGTNLNFATPKITIDNIPCTITGTPSPTSLQCTTQPRPTLPNQSTFTVTIGQNKAVLKQQLLYVMRWSDIRTWGTDLPPVEGDLVYVPKGMALYVDQSTPRLDAIVVEDGKLIFADQSDMEIHVNSITLKKGQFRAGTDKKPYTKKLTFIMYGSYFGKQLPMFGNKGIGCMQCKFSMYGTPRVKTWSTLSTTVAANTSTLTISDTVDWQVGQQIVVASTNFDHNEAEQRKIVSITGNQITVDKPFVYRHLGVVQTYGNDRLQMKAEVGLLTRNIKMMGDQTSQAGQYGSHLMLTGSKQNGFVGHVAYTEFTHCGQPRILGRYCIHFHMNGDVPDSYAKGNAVHHSFARVITLHGVHYLTVSENVGYRVKGHNFFIQDGIETQNLIENNLAIGSLESWNMGQTDISVASFWVTNPSNNLRFNRAAGGDFYGFWYEIKQHPDGPSATEDVCPIGNPLGESHDNVAHSYKRFGLRIFRLYSRQNPCLPIRDDRLADPWSNNPSIQSRFYNYVTYKIGQAGLLAEQTGNMIFQNFTMADSKRAGMQFYLTNFTKQLVQARNMAIIGLSTINGGSVNQMTDSAGVIAPRTTGLKISNIRFYNYAPYMNIFQTCSRCQLQLLFTNTAHQYIVENISYTNVTSSYVKMTGMKRQIIYDLDGSFSRPFNALTRTSATITFAYEHLLQQNDCSLPTNPSLWDETIICDQNIKIRRVTFTNLLPTTLFEKTPMKAQLLSDVYDSVLQNSTAFTQYYSTSHMYGIDPMVQRKKTYAMAFAAGRIYNVWWLTGLDFTHVNIDVSPQFYQDSDPAILFKFNYTANRQLFQIGHLVNGQIQGNFSDALINQTLDNSNCQIGDYMHDVDNQWLTVCATSRGKTRKYQYLDIRGVTCRYICPDVTGEFVKEKVLRVWSNHTQWPGGVMPAPGDDVTIEGQWTILMDMEPVQIGNWVIKGDVIIPNSQPNIHIKANNIWIKSGALKAGTAQQPYIGNLTIQIMGNKNDRHLTITPQVSGNKLFVVNGKLQLYGIVPDTPWTKLTSIIRAGDTQMTVQSAVGWQVGDQLGIASSFRPTNQHEKVTITSIIGNTIQFTPALRHTHYGATGPTVTNVVGTLDTRAGVGLLSRNIKIIAGQDAGWGYHLLVYGYNDDTTYSNMTLLRAGNVIFQGVQLNEGGQYDTENSALKLWNTVSNKSVSIYRSSFHNCKSYCLDINNINNADIRENVFFQGRVFIVKAKSIRQYKFQYNLMIAASKRPTMIFQQLIACYATYEAIHESVVSIRHNLCQGSDGHGILLPYVPCEFADNPPYEDNTVGSAIFGFIFNKINSQCLAGSGMKAYACRVAHMQHSPGTLTIMLSKFMITDSNRGITLRFGKQADDSTGYFRNSYVSAISRPTCSQCYGSGAIQCSGGRGVRMLTVTINGQSLPMTFGIGFDVICRKQTFDNKAFIDDVIFENFNIDYAGLPQCRNNSVFQPHNFASDITGTHHLHNTVCNNCSLPALARFTPPRDDHMGWAGGCGRIPCTGKNNYMIQDHTGHYLGSPGFLLANNTEIGSKTTGCTFVPIMNGHICNRLDFGVLEYESIAPDFNTRIMWPVYLNFEGGLWNTTTNGWREWQWDGNQPLNLRHARFVSVVQVNQVYNMTFESQPPIDMRLQFQRRTALGNNSQYIVVKLHYPRPNSIRVMNRGTVMKPIALLDNNGQTPLNLSLCGSNKFFYHNYTIHFVITAQKNCQVRVSLTNSIQLTARFSMDINDFYANDGQTKFIDRMCAVLGIVDTSRLKIVGIYNGSVRIQAYLDEQLNTTTGNATSNDNNAQKSRIMQISQLLSQVNENGTLNTQFQSVGLGPLIDFQFQNYYHTYDTIIQQKQSQLKFSTRALVIGISVAVASILVAIIAGIIYVKRKLAKIENQAANNSQVKIEETIVDTAYSQDGWK